jgi:hypothetical protein
MEHAVVLLPSDDQLRRMAGPNGLYDASFSGRQSVSSFDVYMDRLQNRVFVSVDKNEVSAHSAVDCCRAFQSAMCMLRFSVVCALASSPTCLKICADIADGPSSFVGMPEADVLAHCRVLWRAARAHAGVVRGDCAKAWGPMLPAGVSPIMLWCVRPEDGSLDVDACSKFPCAMRHDFLRAIASCSEQSLRDISGACGAEAAHRTLDDCAAELRMSHTPVFLSIRELYRAPVFDWWFAAAVGVVAVLALCVVVGVMGWKWGRGGAAAAAAAAPPEPAILATVLGRASARK